MTVEITHVRVDGDNMYVTGTVDGELSQGHGWVARTNHMTPDEIKTYQQELLISGKPANLAALQESIIPVAPPPPPARFQWVRDNWLPLAIGIGNALLTLLMRHR